MWAAIVTVAMLLLVGMLCYLVRCFHRFSVFQRLSERNRALSWVAAAVPVAALGLLALVNVPTLLVVAVHLCAAFLLARLAGCIVRKVAGKRLSDNALGITALVVTAFYLGIGVYQMYHICETHYTLESPKLQQNLRVAVLSDSHLSLTLDGAHFSELVDRVQAAEPDVVVLVGDFVDDDSDREDMIDACAALGRLKTTCGVFCVFGNHDDGYYDYRNFTSDELREELKKNGVVTLEDQYILLDDTFYLVGRRDRSWSGRLDMKTMTGELEASKYVIVLDHQPNDYAAEAATCADLVLSGHTHGGHIFPTGQIGLLIGANDQCYGMEVRNGTTFIVTSGVSGWAIPFKTGTWSEFVVIDVRPAA